MSKRGSHKLKVSITTEEASNRDFIEAWHRAERGEMGEPEERLCFLDAATLLRVLSDRRLVLLHTLRGDGPSSIRRLSERLGRDYKNVYEDVRLLKQVGLIETTPAKKVHVPWDKIQAEIDLAA